MWRRVVAAVGVSAALSACGAQKGTPCGDSFCNEREICDEPTKLCIANTPPVISIDAPAADAFVASATFQLVGHANDDRQHVLGLSYQLADGDWVALDSDAVGAFTATLPTPLVDAAPTTVRVRANDELSQQTVAELTFLADRVAPGCALTMPDDLGGSAGTVTLLAGTVTDGSGAAASADLTVDSSAPISAAVNGTQVTAPFTLPSQDSIAHTLTLHAVDRAGNECRATKQLFIDTLPPSLLLLAPSNGELCAPTSECQVRALADDGSGPPVVTAQIDGADSGELSLGDGGYAGGAPLPMLDYSAATITVTATDRAGNSARATRPIMVDAIAPRIAISGPDAGTVFNIATTPAGGVPFSFTVDDQSPALTWYGQVLRNGADAGVVAFDGGMGSWNVPTAATDDGARYELQLVASDSLRQTVASTDYIVDRVSPTFSVNPPSGTRNAPTSLTVTFSEPVGLSNAPSAISWTNAGAADGGGVQDSSTTLRWTGLSFGSAYAGTLAPRGTDDAGNSILATLPIAYGIVVATPANGTVLADGGNVRMLDVAFDPDGVVSFATVRDVAGSSFLAADWHYVDPKTAATQWLFSDGGLFSLPGSIVQVHASAWSTPQADLTAAHLVGFGLEANSTGMRGGRTLVATDTKAPKDTLSAKGVWVVPIPASGAELPSTDAPFADYAVLATDGGLNAEYDRDPNASVPIGIFPEGFVVGRDNGWTAYQVDLVGSQFGLLAQHYGCTQNGFTCSLSPVETIATNVSDPVDVASTPTRNLYVYSDASNRVEVCRTGYRCSGTPGQCSASGVTVDPLSEQLTVAAEHRFNLVLGVRLRGGVYELVERDLSDCASMWNVLASAPLNVAGALIKPVMWGTSPGALYVTPTGNVTVWKP